MIVDADRVPGLHLDPDSVELGARSLRRDATAVRDAGIAVSGAWQGLGACYETPDTDQVLRALDPVRVATDKLADDLDAVADVLDRFAGEVRSLQAKRSSLVARIGDFNSRVAAEAVTLGGAALPGLLAPELSFENQTLLGQSASLGEEFETAELECADRIKAIGSPATLRFRQRAGSGFRRFSLPVEPRSAYLLSGEARHDWEHRIVPGEELRFSITFRTLSDLGRRKAAEAQRSS